MVNNNIQGAIPLEGVGFKAKLKGNYQPGEYKALKNVEIVDGILQNRRNITATYDVDATATGVDNPMGIIGFFNDYVIVVSKTQQLARASGANHTMWLPTALPVPAGADSFHKIVGFFTYNKVWYWVTWEFDSATGIWGTHKFCLYWRTVDPFLTPAAITFASLTRTVILTDTDFGCVFDTFYINKERLVITTSHGVYMSKATDPLQFAAPDGFFIKFPEQNINWSIAMKDSILVLCDNAIFVMTYSTDPNQDSVVRQVTNTMGADHGVMYKETPYIVNKFGIYQVNNLSMDMVMPWVFETSNTGATAKLVAYDNYIIVILRNSINYDSVSIFNAKYFFNAGFEYTPVNDGIRLNNNVFFINMDSGAMHVLDFIDQVDGPSPGYIIDAAVSPKKDFFRDLYCFFLTNSVKGLAGPTYTYKGHIYKMASFVKPVFVGDTCVRHDNIVKRYKPRYEIEIDSFTPDGNEYLMKKFRSIEIMGTLPSRDFEISFAYDNEDYVGYNEIGDVNTVLPKDRVHHPFRVGMNQRARSVSIRFAVTDPDVIMTTPTIYDQLEISDIRTLWTYTGRSNELKSVTDFL